VGVAGSGAAEGLGPSPNRRQLQTWLLWRALSSVAGQQQQQPDPEAPQVTAFAADSAPPAPAAEAAPLQAEEQLPAAPAAEQPAGQVQQLGIGEGTSSGVPAAETGGAQLQNRSKPTKTPTQTPTYPPLHRTAPTLHLAFALVTQHGPFTLILHPMYTTVPPLTQCTLLLSTPPSLPPFSNPAAAPTKQEQTSALLLLGAALDPSGSVLNWTTSTDFCTSWVGVTCGAGGLVQGIVLMEAGLDGQLPLDELLWKDLNTLQNLNLFGNKIR
jgi:hypothetical protein